MKGCFFKGLGLGLVLEPLLHRCCRLHNNPPWYQVPELPPPPLPDVQPPYVQGAE